MAACRSDRGSDRRDRGRRRVRWRRGERETLQWDAIDLYRLKGGKISQEWASEDLTAILNDTGTYKAPWIP